MSEGIVMRVGEALVAGGPPRRRSRAGNCHRRTGQSHGRAFARLIGDQVKGHARVLAIMNTDIMVKL